MSFRPATPYTRATASAKARELDATAFAKEAVDSLKRDRFQILIEDEDAVYLVASGPSWVEALAQFSEWVDTHKVEVPNAEEAEARS